ncbi:MULTISPECIES: UDP-N-acetylmuramoyl-tripeptide--D-alanyl-D-alanine ligase [unclassified Pseudoxanthomonas]|uniref:UDP-N-acetylmuramoyl-tripeptide--D-alanyl-D- alanine ligase n=1 Tax=unclassified Pseudoxanthomonas TaxID=2645906 RepID=UPI00160F149A|nr:MULTISPECIES: UDP-N-acetylmuramoyl-tripeptide--D-alanyl-D-alanine ligase [unclassified Pseudoxanthomonas]MBB3275506.1 UDP-N-acetylmuramoyl-tripeptide--D-alanyl-D-alanine ligase [Pseudoxanthomonas sp. OG2]MBV7473406.1 UDP-N-acetylmuramoyl-tripeptide--D-alanyl-D-alanine ligase [Pseudoxanthomonas sp. PXM05]UBB24422.1 UDP-N-acetylmuramoyl-tripeptide--D-alanyl-D-alanine ligase [Pseudoxanthomonas japonensis]
MKRLPLSLLAHWAGGELHGDDAVVDAMTQDTRALQPGSLYVALRGERFDGHDFAYDAAMRGAAAVLVEHTVNVDLPQIVVPDSQLALARIAAGIHQDQSGRVVAITGSNGKTSVKTLVVAILQRAGVTYFNPGNRNNEIGLPLAVIDAPDDADFAVYEMGAGQPGDIAYLTDIVAPDVALVNNVAAAHLERMGSLLGVAETKGAIYDALPASGTAVINADDAFAEYFAERVADRRILRFGLEASADVTARDIRAGATGSGFTLVAPQGEVAVELHLPGRHNVLNALAAASLALACDVSLATIAEGLGAAQPVAGRQVARTLGNGAVLIDDSYNANPGSLAAAIDALAAGDGEAWLVLGDMRELGADAEALHADAGRRARTAGIRRLYTLGPLSQHAAQAFGEGALHFETHKTLAEALRADLHAGVRCLVKGSRGSAMDKIVTALLAEGEGKSHVA